jgi:hypothetical protein
MDEMILSLATSLASHIMEDGIGAAWSALTRLVRERLRRNPEARAALEAAAARPGETATVERLAVELARIADEDADFRTALEQIWPAALADLRRPNVTNRVNGIIIGGNVIQAGTIHFGAHTSFGEASGPETTR